MPRWSLSAASDKHATLPGQITEEQGAQHRADLTHVDAVLRLFAPEMEVAAIAPKAVRGAMSGSGFRKPG